MQVHKESIMMSIWCHGKYHGKTITVYVFGEPTLRDLIIKVYQYMLESYIKLWKQKSNNSSYINPRTTEILRPWLTIMMFVNISEE